MNENIPPVMPNQEPNQSKGKTKFILVIVAIVISIIALILRGIAIYSLGLAVVVLMMSIGATVMAIFGYQKNELIPLIALILSIATCSSAVCLVSSLITEKIQYASTYSQYEDYSDYFGNDDDFSEFFGDDNTNGFGDNNSNDSNSNESGDYFWN